MSNVSLTSNITELMNVGDFSIWFKFQTVISGGV